MEMEKGNGTDKITFGIFGGMLQKSKILAP
jgi:hypothetical protein